MLFIGTGTGPVIEARRKAALLSYEVFSFLVEFYSHHFNAKIAAVLPVNRQSALS